MDIWQLMSVSIPFLEVMLHTIIHILINKEERNNVRSVNDKANTANEKRLRRIKNTAKYGLTCFYAMFVIIFIIIGLFWPPNRH